MKYKINIFSGWSMKMPDSLICSALLVLAHEAGLRVQRGSWSHWEGWSRSQVIQKGSTGDNETEAKGSTEAAYSLCPGN